MLFDYVSCYISSINVDIFVFWLLVFFCGGYKFEIFFWESFIYFVDELLLKRCREVVGYRFLICCLFVDFMFCLFVIVIWKGDVVNFVLEVMRSLFMVNEFLGCRFFDMLFKYLILYVYILFVNKVFYIGFLKFFFIYLIIYLLLFIF